MRTQKIVQRKSKKPKRAKKIILGILVVLLLTVVGGLLYVPHMVMKDMVNMHVNHKKIHSGEDYRLMTDKVELMTEDGLKIVAQEVLVDKPKAMVIFLSGIHNPSVTAYFGHGKMLKDNGYGSLLVDLRAHGESEGEVIGLGYKEYLDVKAAVEYIEDKYSDIPIVIFGVSMGGATAINSIGEIEEIDGLISMSAYSSFEDVFYENMINMDAPEVYAKLQKPFVKVYTAYKYGPKAFSMNPKNQIKKLGDRPALLMHSKEDSQVSFENFERIMKNAPKHVQTLIVEGDEHMILSTDEEFENPLLNEEYSNKILNFMKKNFDGKKKD
ncbi:alpha/beta hydrolase [Oceanirhabdus sp. W0125-5]|uniref:alpha/beta hydrolase n=1 Tax=Oceanirhabdus sp. W0125-5 TaxID=2999116 RepID=UPI0022F2C3A2|nr:alpha/beta fold hydrolase [Oceanirhabdus sp. W0125-5]WBW98331.1 alpha/beta hydrolase [Oceanirhabdus sp. W0125-5]